MSNDLCASILLWARGRVIRHRYTAERDARRIALLQSPVLAGPESGKKAEMQVMHPAAARHGESGLWLADERCGVDGTWFNGSRFNG
ncbi:MAG: hypothetical protein HY360_25240 [Verrucomicrobia bacterium]|nr:hypothetical protein [Verrucomicrobiota bacterium]